MFPHVERKAPRAAREKGELEKVIAELEGRISGSLRRAVDLRQLPDLCTHSRSDLDRFTFDERRLALRALGFRAFANGDDPARWRCEAGVVVDGAGVANTLPPRCRLMASASLVLAAANLIMAARTSSCVILVLDRRSLGSRE